MRILITNDDSISAAQLLPLVKWAQKLGKVTVVVPKYEQSGKSHGIEIHKMFEVKQVELEPGLMAYVVDSTPADCVRYAILGMKEKFDLVISGVNRGLNVGADMMYSGTVAAVMEAGNLGVQAIALSTSPAAYERCTEHLDAIFEFIRQNRLMEYNDLYNINIPTHADGFRITRQGGPYYSDDFIQQENDMVQPKGKDVFEPSGCMDIDTDAVLSGGYISIMPMTRQRTEMNVFARLAKMNGQ